LERARAPANLDAAITQRAALLESIAMAGTRAVNRVVGRDVAPARLDFCGNTLNVGDA